MRVLAGLALAACALAAPAAATQTAPTIASMRTLSVDALIARLKAESPVERALAACALREQRAAATPAIPTLIALLGDGATVDPRACEPDRTWWKNQEIEPTSPGEEAARALARIGQASVDPLIRASTGPVAFARQNATWALGAIDDVRAVPAVIARLKDEDAGVREQAAWALGALDDVRGVEPLTGALGDRVGKVRKQAAWALGALDDASAVPALVRALGDEDAGVREQAAWALGALDDSRAIDGLSKSITDVDPRVRKQSAWAMGAIDDGRAVLPLVGALKTRRRTSASRPHGPSARLTTAAAWTALSPR